MPVIETVETHMETEKESKPIILGSSPEREETLKKYLSVKVTVQALMS